jgi:transcriptional regulator with XRE-family HTH domain
MTDNSYIDHSEYTDDSLSRMIGVFVKQQRVYQNKTQDDLAKSAGISRSTLSLLEKGEGGTLTTLLRVLRVLNKLDFIDFFKAKKQVSPIALAKLEKTERQRVRKNDKNSSQELDW